MHISIQMFHMWSVGPVPGLSGDRGTLKLGMLRICCIFVTSEWVAHGVSVGKWRLR